MPPWMGVGSILKSPVCTTVPTRALDGEAHRVGDGVVGVDELHGELARLDHLARLAGDELGLVQQAVLLQLQLHQPRGHAGGVDGHVDIPQQIGDGADVVLVSVGEEDAPDAVLVLDEIGEVGDHHVDAVHVVVGKAHAHVDHDDVPAVLVDGHVLADLIESAQGDDFQFFSHSKSWNTPFILNPYKWYVRTQRSRGARNQGGPEPPPVPALPRRKEGAAAPPPGALLCPLCPAYSSAKCA